MRHARSLVAARDSESDVGGTDVLAFDYRDNPFADVIRKIDRLLDTDPGEALRLVRGTLGDRLYTAKSQIAALSGRLDLSLERVRLEKRPEDERGFDAAPLQNGFNRAVLGLSAVAAGRAVPAPAPAQAPSPSPSL